MLDSGERLFINSQFTNEDYCRSEQELKAKCSNWSFTFFASGSQNPSNCGDYIAFAVRKSHHKTIEEIFFSRQEACIIAVSAANILCKWVVCKKKSFAEITTLLANLQRMINGEEYELADCQELSVFSSLKFFTMRKWCLLLVVDSFLRIIKE